MLRLGAEYADLFSNSRRRMMVEKTADGHRLNWLLPLYAVVGTFIVFIPVAISDPPDMWLILYTLLVAPIITLSLLITTVLKKGRRLSILSMLGLYLAISALLVVNHSAVRDAARWLLWSRDYKSKVLAQPESTNGELKHVEWDGWGWAGMDTTVFLVFDPTDSLRAAAKSHRAGKFGGVPCEVPLVRRLESHWYSVRFYTDQVWSGCDAGNASGRSQ